MNRVKLSKEERWIEDHLQEFVPVGRDRYAEIVRALEERKKDAVLNIRVNSYALRTIKHKAQKLGIKYQTFISEILYRVAAA